MATETDDGGDLLGNANTCGIFPDIGCSLMVLMPSGENGDRIRLSQNVVEGVADGVEK